MIKPELPNIIVTPFTAQEVEVFNNHQKDGRFHPYTCRSGNRTDAAHLDGEGILIATPEGWICPYCDYRQNWGLDFTPP